MKGPRVYFRVFHSGFGVWGGVYRIARRGKLSGLERKVLSVKVSLNLCRIRVFELRI